MINEKLMEEAVKATMAKFRAMSREDFRAELEKYKESDFAVLFRIAREFDPNFMRISEIKKQLAQSRKQENPVPTFNE